MNFYYFVRPKIKIIQDFFDFSKISNIDILLKKSKNNGACNCKQKRIYLGDWMTYSVIFTIKDIKKDEAIILYDGFWLLIIFINRIFIIY